MNDYAPEWYEVILSVLIFVGGLWLVIRFTNWRKGGYK